MKLARTLERGLPLASVMLGRPEGDRPRDSESSRSELALFSKMDRRLRTADEDRCSDMAVVWEKEGSNQHSHFPRDDVPMAHAEEDDRCENVQKRCSGESDQGSGDDSIFDCATTTRADDVEPHMRESC